MCLLVFNASVLDEVSIDEVEIHTSSISYFILLYILQCYIHSLSSGVICDFSRQKVTQNVMKSLIDLASQRGLTSKIASMFAGEHINSTEDRAVLHVALRSHSSDHFVVDGKDVVADVHDVLNRIQKFSDRVRSGNEQRNRRVDRYGKNERKNE